MDTSCKLDRTAGVSLPMPSVLVACSQNAPPSPQLGVGLDPYSLRSSKCLWIQNTTRSWQSLFPVIAPRNLCWSFRLPLQFTRFWAPSTLPSAFHDLLRFSMLPVLLCVRAPSRVASSCTVFLDPSNPKTWVCLYTIRCLWHLNHIQRLQTWSPLAPHIKQPEQERGSHGQVRAPLFHGTSKPLQTTRARNTTGHRMLYQQNPSHF